VRRRRDDCVRAPNRTGNLCDVSPSVGGIEFRPMVASDVGLVPIAHQGEESEVLARIAELGSSALLAFDRGRHVGQLQFRRYEPGTRSPHGVWDPLYWMDFVGRRPVVPFATVSVCFCHVGQLDETNRRAQQYLGRGIGSALLDHFLAWASQREFAAVIAKATPARRSVMEFLGGFPTRVYEDRGFEMTHTWMDTDLARAVRDRGLADDLDMEASTVACRVLRLR
jgi:GNAT superfamily N-acetyltransferase